MFLHTRPLPQTNPTVAGLSVETPTCDRASPAHVLALFEKEVGIDRTLKYTYSYVLKNFIWFHRCVQRDESYLLPSVDAENKSRQYRRHQIRTGAHAPGLSFRTRCRVCVTIT